jgi:hypothetical protein
MTIEIISGLIVIGLFILSLGSMWLVFEKAGKPGWAAIVPLYNVIVFLEIIGKPWWWLLLMLIPYINIIWIIWASNLFVKSFGDKSVWSTISFLCVLYIYLPLLAFDKDATYKGLNSSETNGNLAHKK